MSVKRRANRLLAAALGLILAASVQAAGATGPAGEVLLTVAGDVSNVNWPAYDGKRDLFFMYHERTSGKAFGFDCAMLEGLGMVHIRIEFAGWDGPKNISGPHLADLLDAAGCGAGPIATLPMDAFGTEMSPARLAPHESVLSTRTDGRPRDIGGRGPLWLVFDPPGDRAATAEEESMWPWQWFFVRCE